ncbi:hypothetical protein TSMEX_002909 [Taenia solium]|eukprot:TsM_001025900 transcript=TsM_001025900 gene=TsM_001025900
MYWASPSYQQQVVAQLIIERRRIDAVIVKETVDKLPPLLITRCVYLVASVGMLAEGAYV